MPVLQMEKLRQRCLETYLRTHNQQGVALRLFGCRVHVFNHYVILSLQRFASPNVLGFYFVQCFYSRYLIIKTKKFLNGEK